MAAAPLGIQLRLAWDTFSQNRLRTVLTALGLTMGVATLIGVMTLIQGANAYVGDKVAGLGSGVFRIAKRSFDVTNLEQYYISQRNPDITYDDFVAVRQGCSECVAVGASITARVRSRRGALELSDVTLEGQTYEMADVSTRIVERGRYFTLGEQRRAAPVCVIGAELADRLFPGVDPLGRSLRIDREPLEVIGVYERVGSVLGRNQDSFAVVPMETFRRMRGLRQSLTIEAAAGEGARFQRAQDQARVILRSRRNIGPRDDENFYIGTAETYIALWQAISASFVLVFGGASTIAGLVGGIVIMNMMLVSVAQRTREIGVRRACGARRIDIRRQFLTESVLQCLAGGVLGVGGGLGGAWLLRRFADFPAEPEWWTAALGVGYAVAIGLFFEFTRRCWPPGLTDRSAAGGSMTRQQLGENVMVALDSLRSRLVGLPDVARHRHRRRFGHHRGGADRRAHPRPHRPRAAARLEGLLRRTPSGRHDAGGVDRGHSHAQGFRALLRAGHPGLLPDGGARHGLRGSFLRLRLSERDSLPQ